MRIGLTSIFVDDQDQAEQFYTQALGLQVKTSAAYGPGERWLSVVALEDPDGTRWRCTTPTSGGASSAPAAGRAGQCCRCAPTTAPGRSSGSRPQGGVRPGAGPGGLWRGWTHVADGCGNLLNLHQDQALPCSPANPERSRFVLAPRGQ
jgi:catechol 2,3-dioxygenase-like lactoylglutathione lyase family enzyme